MRPLANKLADNKMKEIPTIKKVFLKLGSNLFMMLHRWLLCLNYINAIL
jgi:hypothetical protein